MATKKKAVAKKLAPDADVNPVETPYSRIALYRQPAGVRVDEETALTLGAVWACVRVISETIAGLPWGVFQKMPIGRLRREGDPADWLISTQANPETSAFNWREMMLRSAAIWGNGYSEIERDGAGRPTWLWQLTPDRVCPERDERGVLVYRVRNGRGLPDTILAAEDMYHVPGPGFDGIVGYSVIRMAARTIGVGIGLDQSSASFFENDSTPGGILEHPARLSVTGAKNLRETWNAAHKGPNRRRTVAILEEGMKWHQTGLPPEDAQLIQARQLTPSEICRWFRVQPHKIADLTRSTNNNIEHQSIEFVTDTLMPWVRRLETEADIKFFGRTNRGTVFTRINMNGLLRGDTQTRSQFYQAMLDRGVFSINDVLELEDRNEIGPDGDKRFVPLNMQLLEKAGEEPVVETAPPEEPAAEEPPAEEDISMFRPILLDACERIARREKMRREEKAAKLGADELAAWWLEFLSNDHRGYCLSALNPIILAMRAVVGRDLDASPVIDGRIGALKEGLEPLDLCEAVEALAKGVQP